MMKSFCLLLLLLITSVSELRAARSRAQLAAEARAAEERAAQTRAAAVETAEVNPRKEHCDKAYRALRRNHDNKDCVDLEEAIQRAHKLVDGADFDLSTRAAGALTENETLAIVEKLEQIHRALADDLTKIVWSFVSKLTRTPAGQFEYNRDALATVAAGGPLGAQDLNDAASWLRLLNAKLNNDVAGNDMAETAQVDRVREALISLVVLAAVGGRDVGSIAGGFDESQLHAAIAKQLWVMDSVKLMKAMSIKVHVHGYTGVGGTAIANLDTLSNRITVRAHTHDVRDERRDVGEFKTNAIEFARARAALDKLLTP